ncbi:MAG TPA: hypothetical protein VL547_01735 [Dinghuibacter sp.]|uniref:hypothetical protein n=1 Tax=Dinghuibacter sp. TaxID=2024697 RepID=UPI002C654AB4|nr:hypothetical protein [Dinghuibacter sp.]HTJ10710.1 hypothetical protein [Dinghuibacter sp.]
MLTPTQVSDYSRDGFLIVRGFLHPYNEPHSSSTTPLQTVPDEALMAWTGGGLAATDFLDKNKDEALK